MNNTKMMVILCVVESFASIKLEHQEIAYFTYYSQSSLCMIVLDVTFTSSSTCILTYILPGMRS